MKRWIQLGVLCVAMLLPATGRAQLQTVGDGNHPGPVKAQHLTVALVEPSYMTKAGQGNVWTGIYFELEPGWHVYWINAGDSGEPPNVKWTMPEGVTAGPMQFPPPKRLPLGPLMDFGYEGKVAFPVMLTIPEALKDKEVRIYATISWLVCREVCIPGKASLGMAYQVESALFSSGRGALGYSEPTTQLYLHRAVDALPKPLPYGASATADAGNGKFLLTVKGITGAEGAEFYPFDTGVIANAAAQKSVWLRDGVNFELVRDDTLTQPPATLHGLVKLSDSLAYDVTAQMSGVATASAASAATADTTVQSTANTAVLSEPVASAAKSSVAAVTAWTAIGLAFLGGIILNLMPCVFPVLFLKGLALVQSGGEQRARTRMHGLVYTLGIVTSFWVILGVLLALRAGGARLGWGFQLQSPAFVAVLCCGLFFFALSLAGMFDFGLTLTSAGGELAQKQGYAGSFFTGVLATVVATPCTAPLMGAAIGFALAQPAWVAFTVFTAVALGLALPFLLLSLQPAWTRWLPKPGVWMEVLKQVTALPLFATVIWLAWVYGMLRGIDEMVRLLIALLAVAVAAWVMGRWPGKRFAAGIALVVAACGLVVPLAHREAVASEWVPYSAEALAEAQAEHKPVFVDFTAAWCLSCHVNEEFVLDSAEVKAALQDGNLVLMRADWTKYDPAITQALAQVNRSGVPTYVIYPADGGAPDVLPELLSKSVVIDALKRDVK